VANNAHTPAPIQASDIHVVDQSKMKKALRATLLGNFMEWYDIGVFSYGMTYITLHFFPLPSPWDGLASFATLAVTFLVRPLGGLILGPIGDRVGRKAILAFTIIMMSAGTFLIGCLPTYQQIGIVAPVLLILLKFIQGFSTGGEYAGAATFIAEYASDKKRGFWGVLPGPRLLPGLRCGGGPGLDSGGRDHGRPDGVLGLACRLLGCTAAGPGRPVHALQHRRVPRLRGRAGEP